MTAAEGLSCQELVELVTDYLEDALAEAERRRFEAHLMECEGCTAYLAQMRETIRTMGRLREDDLEPQAKTELLAIFRDWRTEQAGAAVDGGGASDGAGQGLADRLLRWVRLRR